MPSSGCRKASIETCGTGMVAAALRRGDPSAAEERRCSGLVSVFFFQAEDGIRDYKVTGVQTCALPILVVGDLAAVGEEEIDAFGGVHGGAAAEADDQVGVERFGSAEGVVDGIGGGV